MAHSLSSNPRPFARNTASIQSQHAAQEDRIPSGIVGARLRQLKSIANKDHADEFHPVSVAGERENTSFG